LPIIDGSTSGRVIQFAAGSPACMVSGEGFETWDEKSSRLPAADRRSGSPDPARLAAGAANVLYSSQLGIRACAGHGRGAGAGQAHRASAPSAPACG
jgi:hypothetical protein